MNIYIVCSPINWTIIKNHHDIKTNYFIDKILTDRKTEDWYLIYIINAFIYAKVHIE